MAFPSSGFNPNHPANASVISGTRLSGAGGIHPDLEQRISEIKSQLPDSVRGSLNGWVSLSTVNNGVIFALAVGMSYAALRLPSAEIERAIQKGGLRSSDEKRWVTADNGSQEFIETPLTMGDDWVILKNLWTFDLSWWRLAYDYTKQIAPSTDAVTAQPSKPANQAQLEDLMAKYRRLRAKPTSDFQGALNGFNDIITENPAYALAYYERAQTHHEMGHLSEAITDLTRAIELDSSYVLAYHYRAQYQKSIGATDAALADYKKAVELFPQGSFWDEVDQTAIASILDDRGEIDAAIAIYDDLIRAWPQKSKVYPFGTAPYYEQRALLLIKKQRYDEAIADYQQVLAMQPRLANQIAQTIDEINVLKAQHNNP